jgi:3-deoxy-D-manno-octulosonic acid kinase
VTTSPTGVTVRVPIVPAGRALDLDLDPEFVSFSFDRRILYLRKSLAPLADAIVAALAEPARSGAGGEGNRQSASRIVLPGAPEMVARAARRGGLMRRLLTDLYFGLAPRPLRELQVTLEARRRGIPVADPMGAMVQWAAPGVYRGFFLTRAIAGMTLWELLRTERDLLVRGPVLEQARLAIATMHARGLFHADLNLHNLFVTRVGASYTVIILDLDKARLFGPPLAPALRRRNLRRLLRSARKLDPDSADLAIQSILTAG